VSEPTSSSREHSGSVCVVGSVNLDLVATCPRLPAPGETVTDGVLRRFPGGKGANQALAASRHDADVTLIAAIGADDIADQALAVLRDSDVDLSDVVTVKDESTGVALIAVDKDGQNQIVVTPGANRRLRPYDLYVRGFDAVLSQLEVPLDTVIAAAEQADELFCLNAAPSKTLPQELIELCDVIIMNEPEHTFLANQLDNYHGLVITTLGSKGAAAHRDGMMIASAAALPVDAVDTVGAGDAFCGALVAGLARGDTIDQALTDACSAGSHATTHLGAQTPR